MRTSTIAGCVSNGMLRQAVLLAATAALLVSACGSPESDGEGAGSDKVGVSLITRDSVNPFFVAMHKGAKEEARKHDVDLTVTSGKADDDEAGQVAAIEAAIGGGHKGILITPNGPGVNAAIGQARRAGLLVIALDAPPNPASTVDMTVATDDFQAGKLIGQWAAARLGDRKANIALIDPLDDQVLEVSQNHQDGFLSGMGIDARDQKKTGGEYEVVCHGATGGAEDSGRTAMERCLAENADINVVYTLNEFVASGAYAALEAAGKEKGPIIVSAEGNCGGVELVKDGIIGATAQQYPRRMAALGLEAIATFARENTKPTVSEGLDFFNSGVALVTDKPVKDVESVTSDQATDVC